MAAHSNAPPPCPEQGGQCISQILSVLASELECGELFVAFPVCQLPFRIIEVVGQSGTES